MFMEQESPKSSQLQRSEIFDWLRGPLRSYGVKEFFL